MPLESATHISDFVLTNPVGASDNRSAGDDHLRLIKTVLQTTFPNATRAHRFATSPSVKTTNYTVLATDDCALIRADATAGVVTIGLPANTAIFTGFSVRVQKVDSSSNNVITDGDGADTINGTATRALTLQYQTETYMWDGSEWKMISGGLLGMLEGQLDVNGFALGDGTLELLAFTEVASAVNHLLVRNAAAGSRPALMGTGDDVDVGIDFITKGDDGITFFAATTLELLKLPWIANAVNFLQVQGAAAGRPIVLAAFGDDPNISVNLQPKGTGGIEKSGTALPFQNAFEGTDTSISAASTSSFTHGLGAIPKLFLAVLKCTSTEFGFAVDDELAVTNLSHTYRLATSGGVTNQHGCTVWADATTVDVRFAPDGVEVAEAPDGTDDATLTFSKWELIVRAYV